MEGWGAGGMEKMEGDVGSARRGSSMCVCVCVKERRWGGPRGVETNKSLCRLSADTQLV